LIFWGGERKGACVEVKDSMGRRSNVKRKKEPRFLKKKVSRRIKKILTGEKRITEGKGAPTLERKILTAFRESRRSQRGKVKVKEANMTEKGK